VAEIKLTARKRSGSGKGAARRSRADGKVPAVVYGHGMDPLPIEVDRREFVQALHTDAGLNVLLDMDIDGTNLLTLTKELQRDPLRGTVLHADFIQIDRNEEVQVEVPLHLVGHAPGADEGGVLQQPRGMLQVRCVVTRVPESIEADISGLNIGDALRIAELPASADYQILDDPDAVVASVAAPVSEEELEAMAAEAGIVEEEPEEGVAAEAEEGEAEAPEEGAPEEGGEGAAAEETAGGS
jgi:large subunit ribosomal protein L25